SAKDFPPTITKASAATVAPPIYAYFFDFMAFLLWAELSYGPTSVPVIFMCGSARCAFLPRRNATVAVNALGWSASTDTLNQRPGLAVPGLSRKPDRGPTGDRF